MAQNRRDPTSDWPARPGDAGGRPQHIAVHDQGSQRRQPSATPSERTQRDSSPELGHPDDWSNIEDPLDRRRVQNRLAQRKFREKARQKKESTERDSENKRLADGAYRSPAPEELNDAQDLSGVPWGSLSMAHVIKAGRAKTQSEASSRQPSVSTGRTPDPSTSSDVASTSHTSGSLEEGESSMFWWSNDISQPAPVGGGLGGGPVGKDAVDAWDMDFDYDFAAFDCDLAASLLAAPDAYPADDWIGQPGWRLQ